MAAIYYDQALLDDVGQRFRELQEAIAGEQWEAADIACALLVQLTMEVRERLPKHESSVTQGDLGLL